MIGDTLLQVLACPDCTGGVAPDPRTGHPWCEACGRRFAVTQSGILQMMPTHPKPLPEAYDDPDYVRMSAFFEESTPYFTEGNSLFKAIHDSSHATIARWRSREPGEGWICDIGCGQGCHYGFHRDAADVIGVDIRLASLESVKSRHPGAVLVQADSCALPFGSGSIGRAISIYALEHIYHLSDAVAETARILQPRGRFFVGLPCEGGLAWTLGRKLTSEREMSRRYNVDYAKYIALEHCNTASDIIKELGEYYKLEKRTHFPIVFLPFISTNLTVTLALSRK